MIYSSVHNYYIVFVKLCQERFSAIFVLPSRIAAAEKMTCGFLLRKSDRAAVKIHDNDVREPVLSHAILKNRNAYDVRITRGNTSSYSNRRFCVEKRLTKPRVCGIIFPASERGSPRSIFYLGV